MQRGRALALVPEVSPGDCVRRCATRRVNIPERGLDAEVRAHGGSAKASVRRFILSIRATSLDAGRCLAGSLYLDNQPSKTLVMETDGD